MSGIVTISTGNEGDLQSAVANVGPVSTYVDASRSSFQVCVYGMVCVCMCVHCMCVWYVYYMCMHICVYVYVCAHDMC